MPGSRIRLLLVSVVATFLIWPTTAAFGAYWFFQGWLPLGDGTRQVYKSRDCCDVWQYNRISWTSGSHVMNNLGLQYSGSWISLQTPDFVYDYEIQWRTDPGDSSHIHYAGCQIPQAWVYYPVYTNCRFGIGP
jgi:hypothetical protein